MQEESLSECEWSDSVLESCEWSPDAHSPWSGIRFSSNAYTPSGLSSPAQLSKCKKCLWPTRHDSPAERLLLTPTPAKATRVRAWLDADIEHYQPKKKRATTHSCQSFYTDSPRDYPAESMKPAGIGNTIPTSYFVQQDAPYIRGSTATQNPASQWQLSSVMELNGCAPSCVRLVHCISEYDVLMAHSAFWSKTFGGQKQWLFYYFQNHCPTKLGEKQPKMMEYILGGRQVCQPAWLAIFGLSVSRFYSIRSDFIAGREIATGTVAKRTRTIAPKSRSAIAWMQSYFDRVGDKRPDSDGIYLPTCLTERAIYNCKAKVRAH